MANSNWYYELEPSSGNGNYYNPEPEASTRPNLTDVLNEIGPLPPQTIIAGIGMDGMPLLLNLFDPSPGPILIAGDPGTGKTDLLKTIATAASFTHHPDYLQFGVITQNPTEWQTQSESPNSIGIFHPFEPQASDLIASLATWAHSADGYMYTLLLIDGLESMTYLDPNIQQNLRWLLLRGPSHHVWPIITQNPSEMANSKPLLQAFRTRIFMPINDARLANELYADQFADLGSLDLGSQFTMIEEGKWSKFWIPTTE